MAGPGHRESPPLSCRPSPPCAPHVAKVNVGSSTVRVVGLPVSRIGDSTDAGQLIKGSTTVRAG